MIDWTKPIEAYHPDGRVMPVEYIPEKYDGDHYTKGDFDGFFGIWKDDGCAWIGNENQWRIRNTRPVIEPTEEWWARRWIEKATPGEIEAMKRLIADA